MGHSKHKYVLGSRNSDTASSDIFVGDVRLLSLSVQTSTGSASNVTVSLSDSNGFDGQSIVYSTVTVLPNAGIFSIDPGARWMQVQRAGIGVSALSNVTVNLNRYYDG